MTVSILESGTNPNKVIITLGKTGDINTLKVWPSCCVGVFTDKEEDGNHVCDCGDTRINTDLWAAWFYLTETTARVLPEWVKIWTGIEENIDVEVTWD